MSFNFPRFCPHQQADNVRAKRTCRAHEGLRGAWSREGSNSHLAYKVKPLTIIEAICPDIVHLVYWRFHLRTQCCTIGQISDDVGPSFVKSVSQCTMHVCTMQHHSLSSQDNISQQSPDSVLGISSDISQAGTLAFLLLSSSVGETSI